ncbi:hypothetical protein J4477_02635 [Candidatus Pacearchaeota archaeon]|nr:hypothetical protein [Candidatus Pacearchaeota archaeon]
MAQNKPLENVSKTKNKIQEVKMEKLVLSFGGVKDELEKGYKLLKKISKEKPSRRITAKRIPGFGVRPKMEVGCMVTLRGDDANKLLKRLLASIDNKIRKKQIAKNQLSFGIKEYIEIPGEEYDREIGMLGFNVVIVFSRKGKRVSIKKIKRGKLPERQHVTQEEISKFMIENFGVIIE